MYVDPHLPRHIFGWYSQRLGLEIGVGERRGAEVGELERERFAAAATERAAHGRVSRRSAHCEPASVGRMLAKFRRWILTSWSKRGLRGERGSGDGGGRGAVAARRA